MSKPAVSIVTTTFNRAPLLEKTLESFAYQQFKDYEVIVVDDGTDQETPALCGRSWPFPLGYVRLDRVKQPGYGNPAYPNNVGIRLAQADTIILQNAEVMHSRQEVILSLLGCVEDNNAVFAQVHAMNADGGGGQWYCHKTFSPRPFFFCGAIRKKWFDDLRGFDEHRFPGYGFDDVQFADRLTARGVRFDFTAIEVAHQFHGYSYVHGAPLNTQTELAYARWKHAFDLGKLGSGSAEGAGPGPWDAPVVLHNAHTELRYWQISGSMDHLARNADGDQLLFVHRGAGELHCDFGHLSFAAGDYLVLPRGTMWRLECREAAAILLLEATNSSYMLPDKGLLGPHALFDAAMLDIPEIDAAFRAQQTDSEWRVHIKRRGAVSTATFPYNPLDATGWHGDLCVCRINVKDFRPVMSHRYHLPPSVHSTFVANRFVVCTFAPRPFETDPGAIKVPFFHNNDDYDEVIFYHAGDFFSRDNIHPGMLTFHPSGFTHGPHPKALERMLVQSKAATDEVAVMIDCRDALEIGTAATRVEWAGYVDSWKGTAK